MIRTKYTPLEPFQSITSRSLLTIRFLTNYLSRNILYGIGVVMNWLNLRTLITFFLLVCSGIFHAAHAKTVSFTIFSFNDVYTISPDRDGKGGYAGLYTLLEKEREKAKNHITTVNGDFLFPSILSAFDKAVHRIELLNDLGVDLVALGNHEFDFGPEIVKERIAESKFQWLAANAFDTECRYFTGSNQTKIIDVEGVKIGFFGLITVETPLLSSTNRKVCFTPIAFTAKQMVQQLKKEGADVIVALTHLFMEEDRQLAVEVPEIDVILGGHDHDPFTWYDGKTFVHKSGQNAHFLSRINLLIEKDEKTSLVKVFPSWKVIANHRIPEHPKIAGKIQGYEALFEEHAKQPVAITTTLLDSSGGKVRSQESTVGNLIADALRFSCNADVAIISGGIIRGDRTYAPGTMITFKDILSELPFANICYLVEITGEEILEALENGVSQIEGKAGRFAQVSGIEYAFDSNQLPGRRITHAGINGLPLDRKGLYRVATVDYMYNGGDGYNCFKKGKLLIGPLHRMELVTVVVDYLKKLGRIHAAVEDRINCVQCSKGLDDNFLTQSGVAGH